MHPDFVVVEKLYPAQSSVLQQYLARAGQQYQARAGQQYQLVLFAVALSVGIELETWVRVLFVSLATVTWRRQTDWELSEVIQTQTVPLKSSKPQKQNTSFK
jgi:hypothetical protein